MTAQAELHEIMQIYTVVTSSVFYKYWCFVSSSSFKIGYSVNIYIYIYLQVIMMNKIKV